MHRPDKLIVLAACTLIVGVTALITYGDGTVPVSPPRAAVVVDQAQ